MNDREAAEAGRELAAAILDGVWFEARGWRGPRVTQSGMMITVRRDVQPDELPALVRPYLASARAYARRAYGPPPEPRTPRLRLVRSE